MISDATLLRRYAQQGEQEAFTELVRRNVGFVYGAALRQCRHAHRAEDVTQTVFTDLARKAPGLCERDELLGWLFLSTRYASVRLIRSETRRGVWESAAAANDGLDNGFAEAPGDEDVDWVRLRPELDAALGSLGEVEREAILLRVFKGCSFAEVGSSLQVSEDAARKRVDRALDKLRLMLARRGITSTAAALALALSGQAALAAPAGLAERVADVALVEAASGAAGVGTGFGFAKIFASTQMAAGVAVAVAAIAAFTMVRDASRRDAAEAVRDIAVREHGLQAVRLQALSEQAEMAERERAELEKSAAQVHAAAEKAALAATQAGERSNTVAGNGGATRAAEDLAAAGPFADAAGIRAASEQGELFFAAHPEAREFLRAAWRAKDLQESGGIYRELGLTPEEIVPLQNILMEGKSMTLRTSLGGVVVLPLHSVDELRAAAQGGDRAQRLAGLLGVGKHERFESLSREHLLRAEALRLVRDLGGILYYTDSPLAPSQADGLLGAILKNSSDYRSGRRINFISAEDWGKVLSESGAELALEQRAVLGTIRHMQESIQGLEAARNGALLLQRGRPGL